jgi:hypothetical protein
MGNNAAQDAQKTAVCTHARQILAMTINGAQD